MRHRFSLLLSLPFSAAIGLSAQMHHVDAPEHVTRAVGVYEWTGDLAKPTASRFVPVSLFIDGHFEDAGVYLARPVPFALQTGNLYTVERSGEPAGALALDGAERVVSGNAQADGNELGAWYAYGKFTADAAPKPGPALRKSAHLPVIQSSGGTAKADSAANADTDDGKPHMSRRTTASSDGRASQGSSSSPGTSTDSKQDTSSASTDDTDRPTLARRNPAQDASRRKAAVGGKGNTASVTAVGPAPGDDPDRPTLSHKVAADDGPKELTGMPADLHQAVAVSDPVSREPHPFARPWEDAADRAGTLAAMETLARPRVANYLAENKLVPSVGPVEPAAAAQPQAAPSSTEGIAANTENGSGAPPKLQRGKPAEYGKSAAAEVPSAAPPPSSGTGSPAVTARKAATKPGTHAVAKASAPAPLTLTGEQVAGYTLSYGGLPTFVYTASVPAALATPRDLPSVATHPTVYVTVVAQRLPSGELQVALSSVTDSLHLDRTPRLHLVDAVDPDASHRASLLFELRGSNNRQFALYRLVTARAENTFTSASIE